MSYSIRKIEEKDFPTLISMFKTFATFQKAAEKMTNSVEQMNSEKGLVNGFVAEDKKGEVIGYATCFFAYFTWIGKSMYMDDLFVAEEHRGNGLGLALINSVIELAKSERCQKLHWQVSEWNKPAIEFYKSIGATIDPVESNCDLLF